MTEPKRPAHRPKLPEGEGKTARFQIRWQPDLAAGSAGKAKAAGLSLNAWIVRTLRAAKR